MTAAMYLRKSRAEENEPIADTLARHRSILQEFAQNNDIVIAERYEEVVSGDSLFARPAMLRLLDEISRFDSILCMDIDRLGRGNMKEQGIILETIKQSDVKIITPRKTYDLNNELDETYSEFQAFIARQELKMIRSRMQRGLRRSAEEGYHLGPSPYGYTSKKCEKKTILEPLPDESEIVKLIFKLYLEGCGVNMIAGRLNEMGVIPRKASRWFPISVRRILCNDVYAGLATYGKLMKGKVPGIKKTYRPIEQRITVPGVHVGLISLEDYTKVQEIMKMKYRPPTSNYNEIKNPMAGLIKCQQCGHALSIHHYKEQYYLLCKTKQCTRMANMEYIEQAVLAELRKSLIELEASSDTVPIAPNTHAILQGMERDFEKLQSQKEKLHDLLEQGVYTITVYNERMSRIQDGIKTLGAALKKERAKHAASREVSTVLVPKIQRLLDSYNSFSPREKNELMKAVIKKITYAKALDAAPRDFSVWVELKTP